MFYRLFTHSMVMLLPCTSILASEGDAVMRMTEIPATDAEREVPEAVGPFGLKGEPFHLGPSIEDREAWKQIGAQESVQFYLRVAEESLEQPVMPFDEAGYRAVVETGDRTQYDSESKLRSFVAFVIAELIINDGRYIPRIQDELRSFLDYPTWVYPSHSMAGKDWDDTHERVDLASSALGHTLVLAVNLLGDRIAPKLAQSVRETAQKRVVDPYLKSIRQAKPGVNWWIERASNWNAVCHEGVVGTALGLPLDPAVKEEIVASALKNLKLYYFDSFTDDGYLGEGLGYWSYGFGQYLVLAEIFRGASDGKIEIMDWPEARLAAEFPYKYRLSENLYPSYGDCYPPRNKPDVAALQLLAANLPQVEAKAKEETMVAPNARHPLGWRLQNVIALAAHFTGAKKNPGAGQDLFGSNPTTWFPDAQVFVQRSTVPGGLSFAIKGGWNDGSHHQNDIGSFIVGVGDVMVLADPGMNIYTPDNFDHRRFDHDVNNSHGHSTPVIDGTLQGTGAQYAASVLDYSSNEKGTRVLLDIRGAYRVKHLTLLTREVLIEKGGKVEIIDRFEAEQPISFESGLITFGNMQEIPGGLRFTDQGASLDVRIESSVPWTAAIKPLTSGRTPAKRAGVLLSEKASSGSIRMTITASPAPARDRTEEKAPSPPSNPPQPSLTNS